MDWNGALSVSVMDAPVQRQTLGQDAAPFQYLDRNRIIFQGQALVANGSFELEVPASIKLSEAVREGRVLLYARPEQGLGDASGYILDLQLGGAAENTIRTNGPSIQLWLDSEEFNPGDVVSPNPILIARLQSELGIDLTRNTNHTPRLLARLDGETVLDLTERYMADPNTYQSGSLIFPLFNLAAGPHSLTLFAADNHRNEGSQTVNFVVSENTKLQLRNVKLFPNPARNQVSAVFEHNKSGEPVAISFAIYNLHGQLIRELPLNYEFAAERITGITWDVRNKDGSKVSPGVYVYSIRMQSLRDGSSTKTGGRLIVLD
jgi:hypothetical protein